MLSNDAVIEILGSSGPQAGPLHRPSGIAKETFHERALVSTPCLQ